MLAKVLPISAVKLRLSKTMVLSTANLDLECAHERRDSARRWPIQVVERTMQEAGPIGVPAACGIDHGTGLRRRNQDAVISRINRRTFSASRHDQRTHLVCHFTFIQACPVIEKVPFIFIDRDPGCVPDESTQFLAIEHRQTLARIKQKRNIGSSEL